MRERALVALAALAVMGCHFGSNVNKLEPARGPHGATVRLYFGAAGRVPGELLTVSDTALMVQKADGALMLARYQSLTGVSVDHMGGEFMYQAGRSHTPVRAVVARWRLVARYPQGLPADQLAQLLRGAPGATLEIR